VPALLGQVHAYKITTPHLTSAKGLNATGYITLNQKN